MKSHSIAAGKNKSQYLDIRNQFREAWKYTKDSKNYVYAVSLIFIFSIIIGFVFSDKFNAIYDLLKEIINQTEDMNFPQLFIFILQNNLKVSLYALISGIVLGLYPLIATISNGVVIGFVLKITREKIGILEFWRLIPHGVFELPAVLISLGLGVKLGFFIFSKNKKRTFKERLYHSINVILFIVLPLLIIAALIESSFIAFFKYCSNGVDFQCLISALS